MKIKNKRLFTAVCLLFLACAISFFSIGYGQAERENSVFFENVRGVKNVSSFELPAELGGLRGIKIEYYRRDHHQNESRQNFGLSRFILHGLYLKDVHSVGQSRF